MLWLLERMKNFESKSLKEEVQCAVCMNRLNLTDIAALRCGHTFHHLCIRRSVSEDHKCPLCENPAEEGSIIPRLFLDITEGEGSTSAVKEADLLLQQIKGTMKGVEKELEIIQLHIKQYSTLAEVLYTLMTGFNKIFEQLRNNK